MYEIYIGEELGINIGTDNPHKPLEVHGTFLFILNLRILQLLLRWRWKFIDAAKESGYLQLAAMDTCLFRAALQAQTL